jgi:hypothetical protein
MLNIAFLLLSLSFSFLKFILVLIFFIEKKQSETNYNRGIRRLNMEKIVKIRK